jgi:SRSO17 transposase
MSSESLKSGAGTLDRSDNCQARVFLGYASRKGATLLDRRLYLPESWFAEEHKTAYAGLPDS